MALTDLQTRDEEQERQHLAEPVRLLERERERLGASIERTAKEIQMRGSMKTETPVV
ncbi:hypothetical protein [Streptomyces pactum]|uniref:hypothetical protein n=1 Tax=Streptomyces pactum TaxID=68249 RepID=UPI000B252717|nr:hypothetical protein [Streptomyces pactum]